MSEGGDNDKNARGVWDKAGSGALSLLLTQGLLEFFSAVLVSCALLYCVGSCEEGFCLDFSPGRFFKELQSSFL